MRHFLLSAPVALAVTAAAAAHAQQAPAPHGADGGIVLPGAPAGAPPAAPVAAGPATADQLPPFMIPVGPAVQNPAAYGMHPHQAFAAPQGAAPGYPAVPGYGAAYATGAAAPPPSPADLAFQQALQGMMPMSPDMIRQFKSILDQSQRAVAAPVGEPPKPVSRSVELTLEPGERAPRLRLYPGNATTLTFSDVTGAAWPVMSVTVGNPAAYQASEAGEKGKTNMVVISPLAQHAQANNLVVTLVGHPVPIIFSLDTGKSEVDYRLDVGIQARGPNAAYDIVAATTLPPTNDATVQGFLDGVPPKGARKVGTSSRDVEAWRFDDMVYVRTPLELLSPAYVARARNVSGVNVYTMVDSPVLLVSQDGRMASVTIEP